MASKAGTSTSSVDFFARLEAQPYRFDFFQALRRIEAMHPSSPGFGRSSHVKDDPVRLGQEPSLEFAPAGIAGFEIGKDGKADRLATYFFGLFGPHGALPTHLTEYALQRKLNEDDPTFARFADIFHHRMMSLLYRAWADVRPTVQFDRPDASRFSTYLGSLFGIGTTGLQGRDAVDDGAKLHYVGALSMQTRNVEGLVCMLQDFLSLPADVDEFVGAWMKLPADDWLRLGENPNTGRLGVNAVIGSQVWGCQQKYRIEFGPMDVNELRRLLPDRDSIRRVTALVRCYTGDEMDWDVRLKLRGDEVPAVELGRSGQLGWTSWLHSSRFSETEVGDVVLNPMRYV